MNVYKKKTILGIGSSCKEHKVQEDQDDYRKKVGGDGPTVLCTRFEEIRMKNDELFDDFYAKLNDIVNSRFNIGKKIPKTKIAQKILRSLLERFRPKITTIEKSMNLDAVKIEELVGSFASSFSLI